MSISMIRAAKSILFFIAFILLEGIASGGFIRDEIPDQIHSLTVKLSTPSGESGTGIIVKADLTRKSVMILTAGHTLEGAEGTSVRFSNGEIREGKTLHVNKVMDYALLEVGEMSLPVEISYPERRRTVGSSIFVVGYSGVVQYAMSHGIISHYIGDRLHTDAHANFGSSGSGVWDRWGRLIGLVIQVYVEEVKSGSDRFLMQKQTIAVDILKIRDDLKSHGIDLPVKEVD